MKLFILTKGQRGLKNDDFERKEEGKESIICIDESLICILKLNCAGRFGLTLYSRKSMMIVNVSVSLSHAVLMTFLAL